MNKKIVILTNTNVKKNSGNMSLILRRSKAFAEVYGAVTEVWVYKNDVPEKSDFSWLRYVSVDNRHEIVAKIEVVKPDIIVVYGDKMSLILPWLKNQKERMNVPFEICLDIQGSVEEKIEYATSVKEKAKYPLIYWIFKRAMKAIDSAFIVSDELKENCLLKVKERQEQISFYKVRCGCEEVLSYEDKTQRRSAVRRRLKLDENVTVFTFSGFRAPWQKIEETISFFKQIDSTMKDVFFMFLCNQDEEFLQNLRVSFPKGNYYSNLCSANEYVDYLCASDVGMLIRDFNETNRVAFPNKFSDYLETGLLMVINDSLPEPCRILKKYSIPYIDIEKEGYLQSLADQVHNRREKAEQWHLLTTYACQKELLYSEQVKNISIFNND